ncbi:MAG: fatty acid desaturase [Chitinophagales bacterium]|nr:fatty acid desaturase [Chitinophagales bacterium]
MKNLGSISDPTFIPKDKYSSIDRFFLKLIRDERDLPFIHLTIKIMLTLLPLGIAIYFVDGWLFAALSVVYLYINNFVFKGSFGLMLHCTSHRKWFKKEYEKGNLLLPWLVGPFFGQSPETYASHHIHMHHAENNLEEDLSSTMFYQRDSLKDFMKYFSHFLFNVLRELIQYFTFKKRPKLVKKVKIGEIGFMVFCIAMCFVNWKATLVVFVIPLLISRFVMMLGNFAQHAFVDPYDPGNSYKNSITCINTKYNHKCWNDGYHISHHKKPSMHWTEHPKYFLKTIDEYYQNNALIFDGIDFLKVWIYLMRKDYKSLAANTVNLNNRFASEEEVIEMMKIRTRKFPKGYSSKEVVSKVS